MGILRAKEVQGSYFKEKYKKLGSNRLPDHVRIISENILGGPVVLTICRSYMHKQGNNHFKPGTKYLQIICYV